jgi:hypothetical protein
MFFKLKVPQVQSMLELKVNNFLLCFSSEMKFISVGGFPFPKSERDILNVNGNGFTSMNSNGIITSVNGVITVLNTSGIFVINSNNTGVNQLSGPNMMGNMMNGPSGMMHGPFGMMNGQFGGDQIDLSKISTSQTNDQPGSSISTASISTSMTNQPGENPSLMSGQIMSVVNGLITITNSSGVFVGNSMESLRRVDKDQGLPLNLNSLGSGQSVSVTNGLITISNSSGIYVGKTIDSLIKVQ